jgi:choline monooxygenase
VCPYHWWAYRLDGTLKATPPAHTPKERKENLGLLPVPGVGVFAGMVFLNQTPSPPPLLDTLGDLPDKLKRYDLDDMELHKMIDYGIQGNWKLIAENFVDFYHIDAVHPALSKFSKVDDHKSYQGKGQYVGFCTAPLTDCGGPGDSHMFNPFPRLAKTESSAALFFQIFPNVSVTIYPHSVYTLMCFPGSSPGETKEQMTLLMAPGARKQQDAPDQYAQKCDDLFNFVARINEEDIEAIQNLQRGLMNARGVGVPGEFLPKYDWPVHRFQNMVIRGLQGDTLDESFMPKYDTWFESQVQSSAVA